MSKGHFWRLSEEDQEAAIQIADKLISIHLDSADPDHTYSGPLPNRVGALFTVAARVALNRRQGAGVDDRRSRPFGWFASVWDIDWDHAGKSSSDLITHSSKVEEAQGIAQVAIGLMDDLRAISEEEGSSLEESMKQWRDEGYLSGRLVPARTALMRREFSLVRLRYHVITRHGVQQNREVQLLLSRLEHASSILDHVREVWQLDI